MTRSTGNDTLKKILCITSAIKCRTINIFMEKLSLYTRVYPITLKINIYNRVNTHDFILFLSDWLIKRIMKKIFLYLRKIDDNTS